MNRFIAIVAMLSFAVFGDDPSPVTKTRLGSLHPREGLVVTGVNFSTNNEALVETIETIGGKATAPRTNENLRSFVKEDGTVYHWITNGIWSTVNLHGNGWDDSYLAGARLYLWGENGVTNWTWYITGGPMAQSRTIAAAADADVLQFKYSNGKTNVFVRGGALMYAENVGGMVSSRFNAASRITTNDVCNIVTNETRVGEGEWRTSDSYGGDWRILDQWMPSVGTWQIWFTNVYTSAVTDGIVVTGDENASALNVDVEGGAVPIVRDVEIRNALGLARLKDIGDLPTPQGVTNIVRDLSLGGIWDAELQVWWTPRMRNGSLTYEATTNVNLNAGN